jgi:hypothetical protein
MNIVLWAVQIILAIKMISVGFTHGLGQNQPKFSAAIARTGAAARPVLILVGIGSFVLGAALAAPLVIRLPVWSIPAVAGALAAGMGLALLLHRRCRENPSPIPGVVLFLLSGVLAVGRMFFPIP